jgi:hypothetical protein
MYTAVHDRVNSLLFQRTVSTMQNKKIKYLTPSPWRLLSHKAQNPLTANDHHTMATSKTTHTHTHTYSYMLSHKAQNLITRDDDQPTNQTTLLTTGLYIISTPSNLKRKEAVDQNKKINARPGYLSTTSCIPRCYSDSDNGGCQG